VPDRGFAFCAALRCHGHDPLRLGLSARQSNLRCSRRCRGLTVEFLNRWFDTNSFGSPGNDLEALPIGLGNTLSRRSLGNETAANAFRRPSQDFQTSYLKVWSSFAGGSFNQWAANATPKIGTWF